MDEGFDPDALSSNGKRKQHASVVNLPFIARYPLRFQHFMNFPCEWRRVRRAVQAVAGMQSIATLIAGRSILVSGGANRSGAGIYGLRAPAMLLKTAWMLVPSRVTAP